MGAIVFITFIVSFLVVYYITKRFRSSKSSGYLKHIVKLDDLETLMDKLVAGEFKLNLFGLTTDGLDCVYFVNENGKVNIEIEALHEADQYSAKFSDYARKHNYKVKILSEVNYKPDDTTVVTTMLRLDLHTDSPTATRIAREIMHEVYNHPDDTLFDILP